MTVNHMAVAYTRRLDALPAESPGYGLQQGCRCTGGNVPKKLGFHDYIYIETKLHAYLGFKQYWYTIYIHNLFWNARIFMFFSWTVMLCRFFFTYKKVTHSYQVQSFVRQGVDFQVSNGPAAVPGVCGLATRDDQHCQLSAEFHGGFHSHGLPKIDVFFWGKIPKK